MKKMNHLELLEKYAAWKITYGFDRNEVQDKWQQRNQGHMCEYMIRNTTKSMYILTPDGLPLLTNLPRVCG